MIVLAFGCVHFASPSIQVILQDRKYDYSNAKKLVEIIQKIKPDAVVNLGDWEEDYYEQSEISSKICPELKSLITYKIKGNHDKTGLPFIDIDGIRYEHGHNNHVSWKLNDIRSFYKNKKVVHAHTHKPLLEIPMMDVGSLTFTGTYGIIKNGVMQLEEIS